MLKRLSRSQYVRGALAVTAGVSCSFGLYYLYNESRKKEERFTIVWETLEKQMFLPLMVFADIVKNMAIPILIRSGKINPNRVNRNYLLNEQEIAIVTEYCESQKITETQYHAVRKEYLEAMKVDCDQFNAWVGLKLKNLQNLNERLTNVATRENKSFQLVMSGLIPVENIPPNTFPDCMETKEQVMDILLSSTEKAYHFVYTKLLSVLSVIGKLTENNKEFSMILLRHPIMERTYQLEYLKQKMGPNWHKEYDYNPLAYFTARRSQLGKQGKIVNEIKAYQKVISEIYESLMTEVKKPGTGISTIDQLSTFKNLYTNMKSLYVEELYRIVNPPAPAEDSNQEDVAEVINENQPEE